MLASTPELKVLIIDGVSIREVDASGDEMLREYFKRLAESGIKVLFTRIRAPVLEIFKRSHMWDEVGKENFHRNPPDVFRHAWDLVVADEVAEQEAEIAADETEQMEPA